MKLGAVLLAAGESRRFGDNKLLADFFGRPLIARPLEVLDELKPARCAVVTGNDRIAVLARACGMDVIVNDNPQAGQSRSVVLGVRAMADMDAVLLLAADQPLISAASLHALFEAFQSGEKGIACLKDETHWGNPAVFSAAYFAQLCALQGDRGAKRIMRDHADDLCMVPCVHEGELADADTPQALEEIRRRVFSDEKTLK